MSRVHIGGALCREGQKKWAQWPVGGAGRLTKAKWGLGQPQSG